MSHRTSKFRVVVTDHGFPSLDSERDVLEREGAVVDDVQSQSADDLIPLVRDADALLVQFATIDERVLAALERCRVIVRYGIGVDTIDVEAATRHGIPVVNVPDYALDEVADHTMMLMLAVSRKLCQVERRVREGTWELSPFRPMHSLSGRTLGVAGFGAIGRRVATRASAFGLRVQAYDPYVTADDFKAHGVEPVDWEQLLSSSDILSVHLPLTEGTRHMFDGNAFARMRRGALLVNTSRGGVIDADALLEALDRGDLAGAGLDVLEEEPPPPDAPILRHPHTIVTSHCAWYTEESLKRLQRYAAEEVARALRGESPKHVINRRAMSSN